MNLNRDSTETLRQYSTLARQELDHADRLHTQAVRIINESKQSGKEVPKEMLAVWDWQHELSVNDRAGVEALLSKIK